MAFLHLTFRRLPLPIAALLLVGLFLHGCAQRPAPPLRQPSVTARPAFAPDKLAAMDAAITAAIARTNLPGGVLWLEHRGQFYCRAYGQRAIVPQPEPMTTNTIFDAASLTKVIATTPSLMLLIERGRVQLDAPVKTYLPEFTGLGRDAITIRHLMTHTSGLAAGLGSREKPTDYASGIRKALSERPATPPGTAFKYSDINFILLGEIVRVVGGLPLNEFAAKEVFRPLGMTETGFLPSKDLLPRIAPTEVVSNQPIRGVVHDPTSRRMGGVAGHAGLFFTASDLAKYCRLLLNEGALGNCRLFKPETVRLMTTIQSPPSVADKRGLGWDIASPYSSPRGDLFPIGSYGHTGWTGTSVWLDPASQTFIIFLSNRNHPTESGSVKDLRHQLATLAAEAIR